MSPLNGPSTSLSPSFLDMYMVHVPMVRDVYSLKEVKVQVNKRTLLWGCRVFTLVWLTKNIGVQRLFFKSFSVFGGTHGS